jgi:hypothetical protein
MDATKLIEQLHRENLCTYFILPLLKLNKSKFVAESNFVDSFLSLDGKSIYVKVVDVIFFVSRILLHEQYEAMWKDTNGKQYIEYTIPDKWHADVQTFIDGKYSKLSEDAKEMIIAYSGLQYRKRRESDNVPITDIRLLSLERSSVVRDLWEEHYNVYLTADAELLSKPDKRSFIDKESLNRFEIF